MKSPKPYSIGRIVIFVPRFSQEDGMTPSRPRSYGGNATSPLPAVIVNDWPDSPGYQSDGIVNLKVLTDATLDAWETSIQYSDQKEPGTWHWPDVTASPSASANPIGGSNPPGTGQPGQP